MSMPVCQFTFDDSPVFDGFAHGSKWNGFDNVAVSKETLELIIDWFKSQGFGDDTVESFRELEPMQENGLYSLGWGFATQIVESINDLIDEYKLWNKHNGLDLGSADEHFFDENLTDEQRAWLRQFSARWEAAADREDVQAAIDRRAADERL